MTWVGRIVAAAGIVVTVWACATGWGAILHGHPLYAVLLAVTVIACVAFGLRTLRSRRVSSRRRRVVRLVLVVLAVGWIALMGWLRPFTATAPALAAMVSNSQVSVTESPTQIVLAPTGAASQTGVFFQPGAKVEARAYTAILRPLAAAGYTVVIPKQPLAIAFLSVGAFDSAKPSFPQITRWVVGGHSLGGTVAAMEADTGDTDRTAPVVGLLFFASYPANGISTSLTAQVLSISGTDDGLATPASIRASQRNLPASTTYIQITGGVHSYFGDYGPQPGDGTPTISHADARAQISRDSVVFVNELSK